MNLSNATNIKELTDHVLAIHNGLCNGSLEPKEVVEIHNGVGKIASLLKTQLEYHKMRGERPDIEFLNAPPTTKTIEQDKPKALESGQDKKLKVAAVPPAPKK